MFSSWNLFADDGNPDTQVHEPQKPNSMDLREVLTPKVLEISNIDLPCDLILKIHHLSPSAQSTT